MSRKQNMPLVSIIIPVYNGEKYVSNAIDSALKQSYSNIEIIIINDGSTDNTMSVLENYKDNKKITIYSKSNGGVSTALNYGIKHANGEYISWLSHDDVYAETKIEKQINQITETNDTVVVCSWKSINKNGEFIFEVKKSKDLFGNITGKELIKKYLRGDIEINGCGVLIPKKIFENVGLFNEKYRYIQDVAMWTEIMLHNYNFNFIPDELVYTRRHNEQVTLLKKNLYDVENRDFYNNLIGKQILKEKSDIFNQIVVNCYRKSYWDIIKKLENVKHIKLKIKFIGYMNWVVEKPLVIIKKVYHFIQRS